MLLLRHLATFALFALFLANITTKAHAVTIDWATVGDPNNAADADPVGYGRVDYTFRIAKHEVTIGQYAEFLNSVAKSDPYGLWNVGLEITPAVAGISRTGSDGSYSYQVKSIAGTNPAGANSAANRPITHVSWFDAARFANWMHNGQGEGSTETGAYTLNGATSGVAPEKNFGALFYVPLENEWYKAAYYKGGGTNSGYWSFATQTDFPAPGNTIGKLPNQANYFVDYYAVPQTTTAFEPNQNYLTDVGAFSGSISAYGTYDQTGNVYEWNDLNGLAASTRGTRGGSWEDTYDWEVSAYQRLELDASLENYDIGFRLASPVPVPEPATWAMGFAAILSGMAAILIRRL